MTPDNTGDVNNKKLIENVDEEFSVCCTFKMTYKMHELQKKNVLIQSSGEKWSGLVKRSIH